MTAEIVKRVSVGRHDGQDNEYLDFVYSSISIHYSAGESISRRECGASCTRPLTRPPR